MNRFGTATDSFLYFGLQIEHRPMVTMFNRAIKLMDYEKAEYIGFQTSPQVKNLITQIKELCNDSKLVLEDGSEIEGPTTAIGYAIRPNNDQKPEVYVHLADQSMYKEKNVTGNRR